MPMLRLRFFVARNPFFSSLVRIYYKLALGVLAVYARLHPKIEALLLTGSGARNKFYYGVSDIDIIVVVSDCEGLDEMKDFVLFDLRLLKQMFPMISTGPHPVVFSQQQLRDLLIARQPFVFSFKAGFKMLYANKETDFTLDYSLEHELAYLAHLWTKFLIMSTHDAGSQYFSYLFNQIRKLMNETEFRIQETTLNSDRTDNSAPAMMLRIACAYRVVFKRLHDYDPAERVVAAPGSSPGQMLLTNHTFFEDQSLDALFSANAPGPFFSLEIINPERLSGLEESESLTSIVGDACDAILLDGLVFPMRPWDKLGLPILNPAVNPLTFAELYCLLESQEPKVWQWESQIRALPASYVPDPAMVLRNKAIMDSLSNRLATMFTAPAPDLSFGICLLFVWNRLIRGERNEGRNHSLLSEREMTNLRAIMACVDQQKYSEAFFKTRNCLAGSDPDPRKLAVSVLIPTCNRPMLLSQALESIVGQTIQPAEVIVVDNGPDDDTRAVVVAFEKDYPWVRYVTEPNRGIPLARNRALVETSADTDVVAFMDDDCLADKNWLYELVLPFQYDPDIVSTGGAIHFNESDRSFWGDFYYLREKRAPI
jgi:hypothetical protein